MTIVATGATDGDATALAAVAIGWLGIVGVNVAHGLSLRSLRRGPRP